jgi:hypothetical protein
LCESRWDDREHRSENPLRVTRGRPVKPYHDVQAHLVGEGPATALRDLFLERWSRCGADPIDVDRDLGPDPGPALPPLSFPVVPTVNIGPGRVAFSRTDPKGKNATIVEIETLFVDAIDAAERLIFIETQYFSSTRIRKALIARMRAVGRPKLEVVVVVNERAEAFKEEIAVGLRQAKNLERLRQVAAATGHALGVYFTLSDGPGKSQRATYIHSKLMAVDDRFLTVGSANLTNRSMEVDSELHVSWEAGPGDAGLVRGIRRLRVSLLAEHAGLKGVADVRALVGIDGLVGRLDEIAARPGARLKVHGPPRPGQRRAMELVDPEKLPFDPDHPEYPDEGNGEGEVDVDVRDEPTEQRRGR